MLDRDKAENGVVTNNEAANAAVPTFLNRLVYCHQPLHICYSGVLMPFLSFSLLDFLWPSSGILFYQSLLHYIIFCHCFITLSFEMPKPYIFFYYKAFFYLQMQPTVLTSVPYLKWICENFKYFVICKGDDYM